MPESHATADDSTTRLPTCVQPECLLKRSDVDTEYLADLLMRLLSGETAEHLVQESEMIENRPICGRCAVRVLRGGGAYKTRAEQDHLVELADRHRRRQRRRQ
jgi:hypothetical protein